MSFYDDDDISENELALVRIITRLANQAIGVDAAADGYVPIHHDSGSWPINLWYWCTIIREGEKSTTAKRYDRVVSIGAESVSDIKRFNHDEINDALLEYLAGVDNTVIGVDAHTLAGIEFDENSIGDLSREALGK